MKINHILIILFISFMVLALHDKVLTDYALENDYYETNDFTNKYSTTIHFFALMFSVLAITIFGFYFIHPYFSIGFLISLNIIWLINNIYSLVIL